MFFLIGLERRRRKEGRKDRTWIWILRIEVSGICGVGFGWMLTSGEDECSGMEVELEMNWVLSRLF